jgi:hypothetical protein
MAVITGPGISSPIILDPSDRVVGSENLAELANLSDLMERSSFFSMSVSCGTCGGRLGHRPVGPLGDRYIVTWTMRAEGPEGAFSREVDEVLYPFADPRPVVYWMGGQRSFMGRTVEGWAVASPGLTRVFRRIIDQAATTPSTRAITSRIDGTFSPGTIFLSALVLIVAIFGLTQRHWWRWPRDSNPRGV